VGQPASPNSVYRLGSLGRKTPGGEWSAAHSPGSFCERLWFRGIRGSDLFTGGYRGTLSDVRQSSAASYKQEESLSEFPESLLNIEVLREAATMVMLTTVALLAGIGMRERCAIFLWTFAVWDITYYAGLWVTVRWPSSLKDLDVLFLIPVPWVSQVWFPILISALTLVAVLAVWKRGGPVGVGTLDSARDDRPSG